jgi:multiple sugar transport system permease protein
VRHGGYDRERTQGASRKRRRAGAGRWSVTATLLLTLGALVMLTPLAWMISTAFKPEAQIFEAVPRWIPSPPTTAHFREVAQRGSEAPIGRWLLNSFMVSTCVTALTLLVASMAAYPLARMRFRGRDTIFYMVLGALIVPGQVTIIPNFLLIQKLGWFDTYPALVVPGLAGPFGVFLLRQYMLAIPKEMEEAAVVDGCGPWRTWAQIILPLIKPALATLATLTFLGAWNDFMWPLIVTNSVEMRTIPIGIQIFQGRYTTEYGNMMATALLASLPVVLVFLVGQRFILRGFVLTGLKG